MPERIPQSVAYTVVFKAYLTDGITPATGKTIAVTISKNTAAFGNPSAGATNATEIASGWYYVALSTTDTGSLGPLIVHGAVATVDNVDLALTVAAPIPTAIENADALLIRNVSSVEATAAKQSLASVILKLTSRFNALTGRTYRTNGTTVHMTQTPTTNAAMTAIEQLDVGV